jgi:predicted DNA binding CopG/RHH family protein
MSDERREQMVRAAAHARKAHEENARRYHETHTYIHLSIKNEVRDALTAEASKRGITRAELIREAIDAHVKTFRKPVKRGGWS